MNSEILEIRSRIVSGETTARAEIEKALAAAKEHEDLHALLEILPEYALNRADKIDAQITELRKKITNPDQFKEAVVTEVGRLVGMPYVAKDNFMTKQSHTTAASKILENFESPLDATAIEKLNNEGAILIGKANLDAFANGGSTENSAFGATRNAVDSSRVAGGTSGGSAVAIAKNIVPFALGSDTGASVRQPASFNGVVGYKQTYGMISRYGVVEFSSSTDVVGPLTHTVADMEILCEILAGRDGRDSTLHENYFEVEGGKPDKLKVGLIRDLIGEGIDPEVRQNTLGFAEKLRTQGHTVTEVDLSMNKYALAIYYIVTAAELSSNLACFDGIRYGRRAGVPDEPIANQPNRFATPDSQVLTETSTSDAKTLDDIYGKSRNEGFMSENKRRIMIGTFVLSSGYFDAYYLQAQKARTLLIREFDKLFADYDFLIGPVAPTPAYKLGENINDSLKMYLSDIMTVPASLAGLPAISLPNGSNKEGLPIGVQIIGPMKSDAKLLNLAKSMETE